MIFLFNYYLTCLAKVVGEEHFGGFLTKRSSDAADESEKPKSWKEKMEEVIAKSKLAKVNTLLWLYYSISKL